MSLTWKDAVTTILAACVFGIYYAQTKGISLPLLSSIRWATIALAILGIAMCAFGAGTSQTSQMIRFLSVLGVTSLILIIASLTTGSSLAFLLLTIVIILMWVLSTARHAFGL